MPTIVKRNGSYVPPHDQDYLPVAGDSTTLCRSRCTRLPHYRCTRGLSHKGDHAAHGNYGDGGIAVEIEQAPMYARWPRRGKEGKELEEIETTDE